MAWICFIVGAIGWIIFVDKIVDNLFLTHPWNLIYGFLGVLSPWFMLRFGAIAIKLRHERATGPADAPSTKNLSG
jgi:hypothetical protein